jgi:iron complex outermembrane receptor protein
VSCIIVVAVGAALGRAAAADEEALARRAGERELSGARVAPGEVLYPADFESQGYTTLPQVLANLVPSFIHPEPALAQGTDHTRPSSLRGLAPDQMVVLLDGKRRNPAAWLHRGDTFGRGSVGVDLSVIPLAAVKRIEILRGGASARYGSGAIAGVINVVLDDADRGGSLTATFGQYRTHFKGVPDLSEFGAISSSEFFLFERGDLNTDDGEGDTLTVSAHGAFSLFDRGFLGITAEFRDQEPTNRSGFDPRSIYPALPNGDFDPREAFVDRRTHRYGNPEQEDVKLLANFGLPLGARTDFYGHLGYTARNSESAGEFVPARSDANVPGIHPDGYLPLLDSDDETRYFAFGFRSGRWGWSWDLSYTQDEHEMDLAIRNSLNASLGGISPTSFAVGNYEGRHTVIGLDVAREVDVGLAGPLALSWGLEYRDAEYENEFGDRAAYVALGAVDQDGDLRPPGSQGLYGVRPVDDFDEPRTDVGGYLELEAPVTSALDALLAVRLDDEEDSSEVSAKLGARWRLTDRFSLRGSVSRDFRHPSPAQTYFQATELVATDGGYRVQGTYPADDPVAVALGAEPLDSETALNVSAGLHWQISDRAAISLDGYQIDIDDRIVLSNFLGGDAVVDVLAAEGITGVVAARYFINGVDTRTRGADLSADYLWRSPWGPIQLRAGFNLNDTDVTAAADGPAELAGVPGAERFGARDQAQLASWTPDSKLHLSARWTGARLTVESRLLRYGAVTDLGPEPDQDLDLGTAWILDLDVRYRLTERGYAGFGIHNMLDDYTDVRPRRESDPVMNRVLPYSGYAPFGFNGRFVYLRLGLDLNRS